MLKRMSAPTARIEIRLVVVVSTVLEDADPAVSCLAVPGSPKISTCASLYRLGYAIVFVLLFKSY